MPLSTEHRALIEGEMQAMIIVAMDMALVVDAQNTGTGELKTIATTLFNPVFEKHQLVLRLEAELSFWSVVQESLMTPVDGGLNLRYFTWRVAEALDACAVPVSSH